MKSIVTAGLVSFLILSGVSLAAQSEERKDHSSMQEMMKDGNEGDHQEGMMRMMKMMDKCAAMMGSVHDPKVKESQKQ